MLWAVSSGRNEIRLVGTTHNRCNCISKNIAITVRAICRRRTSLLSSLTPVGTGIYPLLHLPIFPAKYARSFRKLLRQSLHIYLHGTTFSPEKSVNKLKSQASPQFLLASCKKCLVKRVAITMLSDLNSNNPALCSCLCTIVDLVNGRTCRTFSARILAIFGFQRDVSALFERLKNGFFGPKHFVFIALQLNRRRVGVFHFVWHCFTFLDKGVQGEKRFLRWARAHNSFFWPSLNDSAPGCCNFLQTLLGITN